MKNLLWMVGGGSEATVGGSSCLHCTASTNSFVLHLVNWSLTVEPELFLSIWPGALSAMLRYLLFVCPLVTKFCCENVASETTRLVFEKCKKQKPSFPLSDFAEIFGVHWALWLSQLWLCQWPKTLTLMAQPCCDCLKVMQATNSTTFFTQWNRCTLHGVLISNPIVIFWLNAKQLISCNY